MAGMQRLSSIKPYTFADTGGTIEVDHGSFVGLGVGVSDAAATVTVEAGISSPDFPASVGLLGSGTKFRYPDTDGMNALYNALTVKITWSAGDIIVYQKG